MKKENVKNYQEDSVIKIMYKIAFDKDTSNLKISKLSGGLKNAVYLIENSKEKVVLKIGPKDNSKMISADKNTFWWEAEMLKLMEKINFPAPRLLYFDPIGKICDSPFIFMSYINGKNYLECKEELSEETIFNIEYQIGVLSAKICSIKGDKYFLPSYPSKFFNDNYEFVLNLFTLLLEDAKSKNIDLGENGYYKILEIIKNNKTNLNNNINLCLSHTDIWDGNIIIDNNSISGIVDFSDLYYCDELLTFYFHTIDGITSKYFLKGFDNKVLTDSEKIRIEIYRLYVILKMIVDCELKQYGKFDWMYDNLNVRIKKLTKEVEN